MTSKYRPHSAKHEAFKNRLIEDVFGSNSASDKVPMEKVVMLLWQFRDDPSVITFMARFVAKVCTVCCSHGVAFLAGELILYLLLGSPF